MLFQTPVNSMTVSDQGGGGGRGGPKGPGLRSPTQSSSHTWSDTKKQAKARSEGLRLLLEKKEKLAYVRM